jgi:hypothetical protein
MADLHETLGRIRVALSRGDVLTGEEIKGRVAWTAPQASCVAAAVIRPASTEEVSAVLRICDEQGQPVVTHGGRTGLVGGVDCQPGDVILSLERMNSIERVDEQGRTMSRSRKSPRSTDCSSRWTWGRAGPATSAATWPRTRAGTASFATA